MSTATDATLDIAVLHLVHAGNDNAAAERFVESYLRHPAGYDHRLIFLLKGFPRRLPRDLSAILERTSHVRMVCPDSGYDIGSYYHATEQITEPVILFLNSYSLIGQDGWLSKLAGVYSRPAIGLVGATGSWESMAATQLASSVPPAASRVHRWFSRFRSMVTGVALLMLFPPFPNPHIRSNAFMVARADFLAIKPARIFCKLQAWMFESGRASMTRRLMRRGLKVAVVGRDGTAYAIQEWPESETFWQGRQENLIVHDNRTMAYAQANSLVRERLSAAAWDERKVHQCLPNS